ncbi:NAD(P)/FAD-dependent oxidoreductase [Pseudodonghicola xiamenensis]|uniref:D-amino-acid oxidase n=1 Tax=Pseudodonghicola xiamenensis TaxID=337702 RepID=A0A8J3H9U9_9RHOB|nr:FAD-dependent oxidoreductase [Pseudodonghicola xiamenensis]GHG93525.1 D-amino-acid oxidase [Pseudodonghicola xiamenensis]
MRVVVVGAGIVGASVAWHLARAGVAVELLEAGAGPAQGVTARAFGWVGLGAQGPGDDPELFALRLRAVAEHARWRRTLGERYPVSGQGALVWRSSEAETRALIDWHRARGSQVEARGRSGIVALEPGLREVPELAAWFPQDVASEPPALARALLADAPGVVLRSGARVVALEEGAAVLTDGARVAGDAVVLANGAAAVELLPGLDVSLSPAVLIEGRAETGGSGRILCGPEFEARVGPDGRVVLAEWLPPEGEAALPGLARAAEGALSRALGAGVVLQPPRVGERPVTGDGWPMVGPLPGHPGLVLAVAHPGVILSPFLGRLAVAAVLGGTSDPEMEKFRPRCRIII